MDAERKMDFPSSAAFDRKTCESADTMPEATRCARCDEPEAVDYLFCPSCGRELRPPAAWAMAGGQPERTSTCRANDQEHPPLTILRLLLRPALGESGVPGTGPQPILAHNVLWFWSEEGILRATRLGVNNKNEDKKLEVLEEFSSDGPSDRKPKFCQSPVFDGVFINYLVEGAFCRVYARDGHSVAMPALPYGSLQAEPEAAPLVAQQPRPGKPRQRLCFFMAAAVDGVFVANLSVRREESYAFFRWPDWDGKDRLRSPVLVGDRVHLVSRNGEVLALPTLTELDEDFHDGELNRLGRLEGIRCFAPSAMQGRLVCQTVPADPDSAGSLPLGAFCWDAGGSGPIAQIELKMQTNENTFKLQGRWSCPVFGDSALLLNDMFGAKVAIWKPGQKPNEIDLSNPGNSKKGKVASSQSIVYDDRLLSFDRYTRSMSSWILPTCSPGESLRLPLPPNAGNDKVKQALLCQPIASGRLLALLFKDHIAVLTVDFH